MSQKSVREYDGKRMLFEYVEKQSKSNNEDLKKLISKSISIQHNLVAEYISGKSSEESLQKDFPFLKEEKLVAKPDQLVKRRGKHGLVAINKTLKEALEWIKSKEKTDIEIEGLTGQFDHFILEPMTPHEDKDEFYVNVQSFRQGDQIMFYEQGGVDIGDVDLKAKTFLVETGHTPTEQEIIEKLLENVPKDQQETVAAFLIVLWQFYLDYNMGYVEINPFVVVNKSVRVLDMAAKVDETAHFESGDCWGELLFPAPFGKKLLPEEEYIRDLDSKTGSSLKLTVLKKNARVWTMVAGGGASVIYADTVVDLGFGEELANYGEYSGDPSETLTFEYANTILKLLLADATPNKILLIGGGIANFTNVADTFQGIARAIERHAALLRERSVKIYVRRGGPNYQQGLQMMKQLGVRTNVSIEVFGPETHLTKICSMALCPETIKTNVDDDNNNNNNAGSGNIVKMGRTESSSSLDDQANTSDSESVGPNPTPVPTKPLLPYELFNVSSRSIVYGMQPRAVQGMLDFDHICGRAAPSVVAMVFPFSGNHFQKFYWGSKEIVIPVYEKLQQATTKHTDANTLVNFASCRSVYDTVDEALDWPQLRTIAVIAEGVPERRTRQLIAKAKAKNVVLIGPATVGGIKPGVFRIGNTGGMLDNVIASRLYRPGSVAYVSRSGGLSNELNNICRQVADGVYEGIAIGGDRFPGSTFSDHLFRFEKDPNVKVLVLLGEVGGDEEYAIADAVKSGKITKPLVAWCIGTCAKVFPYEVQFGHAGALALGQRQTAAAKNAYLKQCGAHVPSSFDQFDDVLRDVFKAQVAAGNIVLKPEPPVPSIPMDYNWAQKLGLIRKPTSFMSTISDDRGEELLYAGMPISNVFKEDLGLGGVISLLWFQRRLPQYACKFIEMILMLTADHGPAVAGAHNTIVTARAGKDLVSALCSGLLTIGPRFGGALDEAARQFSEAYDKNLTPKEFVLRERSAKRLIMGIGHRIKSVQNPDMRVTILKDYVKKTFAKTDLLDYALEVEKITTAKKSNLILNIDGLIAVAFVDLLRGSGAFSEEDANEYIKLGCLNGLFVLGRSIGFIAHWLDQVRLKQPLYRHPWDDINYAADVNR